jgi:hypothetical protein
MELGILKTVAPRQKWINEARDFTPWLSNNIEELGSALGLELEVENIEVAVGPYSADILAKDTGTGQYVVIENQLEKTNHDHLGKSITYASVLDASTIIWVATDFTPEHKKAVDWLNDHTSDNISIYGVQLELWQIDNSRAAVKFNVVCKPNDAVMRVARAIAIDELTESKRFQFEFWTKFRDKLAVTRAIPSLQTPRPQYWFDVTLGKSNIHLSNTCNTDQNTVGIRVYIGSRIVDTMLPYLESRKAEIETELGEVLTWNPNPDNRDKVITLTKTTDFRNEKQVDEALDWLVQKTIHFRTVFAKIIKQHRSE